MRILFTILFLVCFFRSNGQHIPVSPYTYGNSTSIDNYFGETDSLLKSHKIKMVNINKISDTQILYRRVVYEAGRKSYVEEFDFKSGRPERTIKYSYNNNRLDAEIIHFPSENNYYLGPSRRFEYLRKEKSPNVYYTPYEMDDTITRTIRMHIRHTWREDGTILFEGFNKDDSLIDTHIMTPLFTWEEYTEKKEKKVYPRNEILKHEEYQYNEKGQLVFYKSFNREITNNYNDKGLLQSTVNCENDKLKYTLLYKYE